MIPRPTKAAATLPLALLLGACAAVPVSPAARADLRAAADDTVHRMLAEDAGLGPAYLDRAHAYAVFPQVAKGAYLVGGSWGRGVVYRQGQAIGYADITGASAGFQFGGQSYAELIVFEDEAALQRLTEGRLMTSLDVSAVVLKTGASSTARFTDGVAVFLSPLGGAMVEAAVGAQQLTFQPE